MLRGRPCEMVCFVVFGSWRPEPWVVRLHGLERDGVLGLGKKRKLLIVAPNNYSQYLVAQV
ncbi:hypothetical protein HBI56_189090 [Parastagonospora nodorum]|uniref:Uncharacterized protein n=1 Tax=Phaeosphaeria nodorum (strain SN15 / ATCC MYA-4574 / FGSC 10173) TaxID=321614 RepID=A0A7U2FEA6_PHANO|nr:hypothetical protein HBH56_145390 [Parastagonospora nodorum]QRD01331.1 hypothetical protein JI435_416420 [Parastagonospora nodorum SN15]KAH3927579.1 hypothetical protein HBH54_150580 [Parastagonospora nodorum]KAH3947838.1 hypothetical protein HBH53_110600 [Parastagonospora nodorum]KAH3960097.1 hypothetical protein HBH51_194440 [Parastagonospora nodorum]